MGVPPRLRSRGGRPEGVLKKKDPPERVLQEVTEVQTLNRPKFRFELITT